MKFLSKYGRDILVILMLALTATTTVFVGYNIMQRDHN